MSNLHFQKGKISARIVFVIGFYFCAAIMLSIRSYGIFISAGEYMKTRKVVIGEVLANTEFPFRGFAKLVTYLMIVSVLCWYCVTKIAGEKVTTIPKLVKSFLLLIVLAVAVIALYEFVYNFIIWSSLITESVVRGVLNLDRLNFPYPNREVPWNLVFATKMTLAAFLIASHAFYVISKSDKRQK
jgi:hypothetical protein